MSVATHFSRSLRRHYVTFNVRDQRIIRSAVDALLSFLLTYTGGDFYQQCPYVEDIDLIDELIVLRNPSKEASDISGYQVADDQNFNVFHFPEGTIIEPKGYLYLYCCAKSQTSKHHQRTRKEPHIQWTNKDGSQRSLTSVFFYITSFIKFTFFPSPHKIYTG